MTKLITILYYIIWLNYINFYEFYANLTARHCWPIVIVVVGVVVDGSIFVLILSVFSLLVFFANLFWWQLYWENFCSLADPPEGVQLQVSEDTVCKGANVIFSCSAADANPMELTYCLYKNNVLVSNSSNKGIWNRTMTTEGVFNYSCKVINTVGTAMSLNVSVTVSGKRGTFLTNQKN